MDVDWTAVAAVAGVAAAIATSVAVVVYSYLTRKQLAQDREQFEAELTTREVEGTRASVREFASVTQDVCRRVADGAAVISTCWLAAELMVDLAKRRRAEQGAAPRRENILLRGDLAGLVKDQQGPFLSLWIRAAETSPSMSALTRDAASLPALASRLRGELSIAGELAAMTAAILDDVQMVIPRALDGPDLRAKIAAEVLAADGEADVLSSLAGTLSGPLATYVELRYWSALRETIPALVETLAKACFEISPGDLIAASGAGLEIPANATRTETIRFLAQRFFERASGERRARVLSLVDGLETQIAKPSAV